MAIGSFFFPHSINWIESYPVARQITTHTLGQSTFQFKGGNIYRMLSRLIGF